MSWFGKHRVSEQFPKIASTTRLHVHEDPPDRSFDTNMFILHASFDHIYVDSVSSYNVGTWEQDPNVIGWISSSNIDRKERLGLGN